MLMYQGLGEERPVASRVSRTWRHPRAALRAWLSPDTAFALLEEDVTRAVTHLHQQARALEIHLADTVRPLNRIRGCRIVAGTSSSSGWPKVDRKP